MNLTAFEAKYPEHAAYLTAAHNLNVQTRAIVNTLRRTHGRGPAGVPISAAEVEALRMDLATRTALTSFAQSEAVRGAAEDVAAMIMLVRS